MCLLGARAEVPLQGNIASGFQKKLQLRRAEDAQSATKGSLTKRKELYVKASAKIQRRFSRRCSRLPLFPSRLDHGHCSRTPEDWPPDEPEPRAYVSAIAQQASPGNEDDF